MEKENQRVDGVTEIRNKYLHTQNSFGDLHAFKDKTNEDLSLNKPYERQRSYTGIGQHRSW